MKNILLIFLFSFIGISTTQAQTNAKKQHSTNGHKAHKKNKSHKKPGGGDGIDNRMRGPKGEAVVIGKNGGRFYINESGNKVYIKKGANNGKKKGHAKYPNKHKK